jgi:hypothetical protein
MQACLGTKERHLVIFVGNSDLSLNWAFSMDNHQLHNLELFFIIKSGDDQYCLWKPRLFLENSLGHLILFLEILIGHFLFFAEILTRYLMRIF